MTSENIPTAEECKEVLGFNPLSEEFGIEYFTDHPRGLYKLTPTRAAFILKYFNKDNRGIKPGQKKEINTSIEEDGWQDDGDTLRFNKKGNTPEFQHRLHVLVERDLTVRVVVVTGCSMDAFTHTAGARPRRPIDEIQRVYNNDPTLRNVSEDEGVTLNSVLGRRGGVKLTMKNAVDKWGEWEKWIIEGEQISEKFFIKVPLYNKWRRIVSSWASLMCFTGKKETAINLLNHLKNELLDETKSRSLTKGFIEFSNDTIEAHWTNTQQSNLIWYCFCHATDQLIKQPDGRIQWNLNASQINHDHMKRKGVYREFLEDPDNIGKEVKYAGKVFA